MLYLYPLFKSEDWEGLTEILSSINKGTKRADLPVLIEALQKKRVRIAEFKKQVDLKLAYLQQREIELIQLEEETIFLSKYPKNIQAFLIKHLGIYEDKLVLDRRLDSRWQKG